MVIFISTYRSTVLATQNSMSFLKALDHFTSFELNRSVVPKSQRVSKSNPPTTLALQNVRVFLCPSTFKKLCAKNVPRMSRECATGMITIASNSWPSSVISSERFNSHSRTLAMAAMGLEVDAGWTSVLGKGLPVFLGSVSTWKVDPKKTFPVKVMLNFLNYVKRIVLSGTHIPGSKGASIVTKGCWKWICGLSVDWR